jgi:pimeloyl-ACP methyl ester carboxylesterase
MMPHDLTITDHEIPLAVRDFGGDGDPVLLLHGLGGTLDAWGATRSRCCVRSRAAPWW